MTLEEAKQVQVGAAVEYLGAVRRVAAIRTRGPRAPSFRLEGLPIRWVSYQALSFPGADAETSALP